jgi:hypothetical protein
MWVMAPVTEAERAASAAALLVAVAGAVRLEEVGDRLRREEHRAWWAGHGRDVINLAALVIIAAALTLGGFPGPAALLSSGLLTLALTGVSVAEGRLPDRAHPRALALLAALVLAAPLLLWPGAVVAASATLAGALFP